MYDPKMNVIVPYGELMNTNTYLGKEYTLADIHGIVKAKKLGFGLNWFGGRVEMLGIIRDLGLLACITKGDMRKGKIVAMLIPQKDEAYKNIGAVITEKGIKACEEFFGKRYPDSVLLWDGLPTPTQREQEERTARKKALLAELSEYKSTNAYAQASIEEIEDAILIAKNEKEHPQAEKPKLVVNENGVVGRASPAGKRGKVSLVNESASEPNLV